MGCGDAKLAQTLKNRKDIKVHSFDLVESEYVVKCDIRKTPLKDGTCDVVIFCLSLMGLNFLEFLQEAYRILKKGGVLKIAEVESRFVDVGEFVNSLKDIGFNLVEKV